MTPEQEDAESANDEEVWACLTSADLAADLATLEGDEGDDGIAEEVTRVWKDAAVLSSDFDNLIASRLQQFCAEAEQMQFNLASMVSKVAAPGPLAPPGVSETVSCVAGAELQALPVAQHFPWPSSAQTLPEYQQRLVAMPSCVALRRELQLSLSKLDCRQDEKDINRDVLEVNGLEVKGSEGGYHAAVNSISHALHLHAGMGNTREAAQLLLSILNRTTSGFLAFEEALMLLNAPDFVVLSPESAKARPLELAIVGGMAMGRAHTRYAVHRADASGELLAVDAFVCFRVSPEMLKQLVDEKLDLKVPVTILIYKSKGSDH
eukprot:symbB.v1.2.002060.t1/scaffold76.1/size347525/9